MSETATKTATADKPDYGIDAPGVIRNLALVAVAAFAIAIVFPPRVHIGPVNLGLRPTMLGTGTVCFLEAVLMLVYARWGKFRHRDHMLRMVPWRGGETVLDVGTGRGLLMIGAAKMPGVSRSVGIDVWNAEDLSGNRMENTLRNAELEGVRDRVEVRDEDARKMSFPDASFDVVLSNLCIHNIYQREGRDAACREILRVLRPGGCAVISDFRHTADYAAVFKAAGARAERSTGNPLVTFPPLGIVKVTKP
jgi:arsenite methyltransferase